MFPWENLSSFELFSVHPNLTDRDYAQRVIDREFRKCVRAERRLDKRAAGSRFDEWKWKRFVDGDFSGIQRQLDDLTVMLFAPMVLSVVIAGMFIVEAGFIPEQIYRKFMFVVVVVCIVDAVGVRSLLLYGLRHCVAGYGQARVEDKWILNERGEAEAPNHDE